MTILRDQAIRLIRTKWKDPNTLAEEIYAMLTADVPVQIDGPVVINNNSGDPDLTVNHNGFSDQSIVINKRPDPDISFPDIPPLDFDPADYTTTIIYDDGGIENFDPTDPRELPPNRGDGDNPNGGGGFPGQVLSGTGNTYQCNVYEQGLANPAVVVSVRQLQIDSGETIPAGTWALIGKAGGAYFMQVPVWLEDLP